MEPASVILVTQAGVTLAEAKLFFQTGGQRPSPIERNS